jgi:hypothetical protein
LFVAVHFSEIRTRKGRMDLSGLLGAEQRSRAFHQ